MLLVWSTQVVVPSTPLSRLLGEPPIVVAGMTPSSVKVSFVSMVLNAGHLVQLTGGGHCNASAFGFHFPLWQEMHREGLPIEGICITAGIPTTEKAAEIIAAVKAAC
ncbi:hypothetical protein BDW22DRAFT_1429525 [Trametopsis cervina]|nr:hypothetical protein BDW22DRAFT_1429525 [Trametopsis cervina]